MALRKSKIRDLVEKHESGLQQSSRTPAPVYDPFSAPSSSKPPPVPEKDEKHLSRPVSQRSAASNTTGASRPGSGRPPKRTRFEMTMCFLWFQAFTDYSSDQISGTNKENEQDNTEGPKKRLRGHPAPDDDTRKALSPASSNTRLVPQSSPGKSKPHTARPSPQKNNSASNILSNLAEKARSTRVAHTSRKMNTSTSTASTSASTSASGTLRTRRGAAGTAPTKATTTRTARKVSGISESSDGSTSTVIKKSTARGGTATKAAAPAAAAKRTVMGTIRRGVTGGTGTTKKTPVAKSAPASTATGRVLRKRNN